MEAKSAPAGRHAGVLMHPTSLSSPFGVGDMGSAARGFVDFLRRSGQTLWQMLPVGPTGSGHSPYDSPSSFAGSPLLIDLHPLVEQRLLAESALAVPRGLRGATRVRYAPAALLKELRLRAAYRGIESPYRLSGFEEFVVTERDWLDEWALYAAVKREQRGLPWFEWEEPLRRRDPSALRAAASRLREEIDYQRFVQFLFHTQWQALRKYCREHEVLLVGDVPMFVRYDGADVWANQHLFHLDADGARTAQAGVPPDYFSENGQLWGNPLYRWDALAQEGFNWWVRRLRNSLARFDRVRLDHFIGFHRVWQVAPGAPDAREGHFQVVPGHELFQTLKQDLGTLPFIAEDLGTVTPEVYELRDAFDLPGMHVLQFAFDDADSSHLPHHYRENAVVYTGTHDNDTTSGWLLTQKVKAAEGSPVYDRIRHYLQTAGLPVHGDLDRFDLIELAYQSAANLCVIPLQDLLGLGSECRMNIPGTAFGNWRYRLNPQMLTSALADRLAQLTHSHDRAPGAT